jgi:hypothetical protein
MAIIVKTFVPGLYSASVKKTFFYFGPFSGTIAAKHGTILQANDAGASLVL